MNKVKLISKEIPLDNPGQWKCKLSFAFETENYSHFQKVLEAIRKSLSEEN